MYSPETEAALYQLEQWYAALRMLNRVHTTVVVVQDSRVARRVRRDSGLPAFVIAHYRTLDDLLGRSAVRLALYVGHSPLNFHMLRFASLVHVSLLHGDSDKTVSVSNQTKGYDFTFVAGQAAIDRARKNLGLFDIDRLIPVGRPGFDAERLERGATDEGSGRAGQPRIGARPAVLYAPTWEGAQLTAFYGSVVSHGEAIVRALIDAGYCVIYRPHPLNGVRLVSYGEADRRIRAIVRKAASRDPNAGHRVDDGTPIQASLADAGLLICDISAVSAEWLPSGKPLIITVPDQPQTVVADTALEAVAPRLGVRHLPDVARIAT